MRTTIVLSDAAYHVARAHAASRRISLGKAISELILQPMDQDRVAVREARSKYPSVRIEGAVTPEKVAEILDDE